MRSKVKIEGEVRKNFWTTRRVRQGYLSNPLFFNVVKLEGGNREDEVEEK